MEFLRRLSILKKEQTESLLQKDLRETLQILSSGVIKNKVLDLLIQLEKRLKVEVADIFLKNGQSDLRSLRKISHHEELIAAANYSIKKRKSFYTKSGNRKPAFQRENFASLEGAHIFVFIALPQGDIGCLYVGRPLHLKSLNAVHLRFLQSLALQFKEIFLSSFLYKSSQEIFSPFVSLFSLLEKDLQYNNKLNRLQERITSVMKVSNLIHSSNETGELSHAILSSAQEVLRTESASLFMLDEDTGEFYFEVITGGDEDKGELMGKRIPVGEGIVSLCAKNKKPILVNNAMKDSRVYHKIANSEQKQTKNLIAIPLIIDQKSIGVIEVINTVDRKHFSQEDLRLFKSFSESVAIAIQRRRLLDDLEKELRETTTLHAIAEVIAEAENPKNLFEEIFFIVDKFLKISCQFIFLYDEEKNSLEEKAFKGEEAHSSLKNFFSTLAQDVYEKKKPVLISDLREIEGYQKLPTEDAKEKEDCCAIFLLKTPKGDALYGVFCLSHPKSGTFTRSDIQLLSMIASELSKAYHSLLMESKIMEQKAIEKEIEIASQIQKNILPSYFLEHDYVEVEARASMLGSVGGDLYYYYAEGSQNPAQFLIGDVAGKSISAALFMAVTSSILKTMVRSGNEPAKVLYGANNLLFEESKRGMFATLFLSHYEPKSGVLQYASAGHNQMILLRENGEHEILSAKGPPLGALGSNAEYLNKEIGVHPGDTLVLYTDGITETLNAEKKEFGFAQLLDLLKRYRYHSPEALLDQVFRAVSDFSDTENKEGADDLALLVCRFKMPSSKIKKYHWRLPAKEETALSLVRETEKIILERNLPNDIRSDILLIAEEAVVNIVKYAYKGTDKKDPQIEYFLEIEEDAKVVMEFRDEGEAYDFHNIEHPDVKTILETKRRGGFGIRLIRSLADHVSYSHEGGKNILRMDKKIN